MTEATVQVQSFLYAIKGVFFCKISIFRKATKP